MAHNHINLLKQLESIANELDTQGFAKEAQVASSVLQKIAQGSTPFGPVYTPKSSAEMARTDINNMAGEAGAAMIKLILYIKQNKNKSQNIPGAYALTQSLESAHKALQDFKNSSMGMGQSGTTPKGGAFGDFLQGVQPRSSQ
jgi:hypothetical protein